MEALERKYNNFKNCYTSLGKAICLQEQLRDIALENPVAHDLFTGGVIQHFKITYETVLKFLKQYLFDIHGTDIASPKQVFRACETHRIFPPSVVTVLITLADVRNTTTHIYDQILAQEVWNAIVKHHQVFGEILKSIDLKQ